MSKFDDELPGILGHFENLLSACGGTFSPGCGSYLFDGQTYSYMEAMRPKQDLLFNMALRSTRALETGVYMGHSLLLMLAANSRLKITAVDIDETFAGPAIAYLNREFGDRVDFIKGDSAIVLPALTDHYDLFHFDGWHGDTEVMAEIAEAARLMEHSAILILDDADFIPGAVKQVGSYFIPVRSVKPHCPWANIAFEIRR